MADPSAERYLTADGWALMKELLTTAGVASKQQQDGYIARLAEPGVY